MCKECGYSTDTGEPGTKFCPQCQKKIKFYSISVGCGNKPSELYEHIYNDDTDK